eukprot:6196484-Pleurochrysis_carterae.AAC.3
MQAVNFRRIKKPHSSNTVPWKRPIMSKHAFFVGNAHKATNERWHTAFGLNKQHAIRFNAAISVGNLSPVY